jgi:hypothetical protein
MTTMQPSTNTQEKKTAKKRQKSFSSIDIGTPQVPVRKRKTKQEHELLSDWEHAS